MNRSVLLAIGLGFLFSFPPLSSANAAVTLEDWIFNIDGAISENFYGDPLPVGGSVFDGLGSYSYEFNTEGNHSILGYFDFEIAEDFNTYFNEYGEVNGTVEIGQSWEIDEPGFIYGDIVDNILFYEALDNGNGVTQGNEEDVAFAMGWDFSLLPGDVATVSYIFTDQLPIDSFYLTQTDPHIGQSLYFYSLLDIVSSGTGAGPLPDLDPVSVHEPGTLFLALIGGLGLSLQTYSSRLKKRS